MTPPPVAVVHYNLCRTPLQTRLVEPSHTSVSVPLASTDLFGNYTLMGPAVVRKFNHTLVAMVEPGGGVNLLRGDGQLTLSQADMSYDDEVAATCNLNGTYVQLDGNFRILKPEAISVHGGKTILNVRHLSDDNCIVLLPGGSISHPVNMCPDYEMN